MPVLWKPTPAEIIAEFAKVGDPDSWLSWVATPEQIVEAVVEGRDALKFSAIENVDSKRRATIGVALFRLGLTAGDISELWIKRLIFTPANFKGYLTDGSQNWINLGSSIMYMSVTEPGEPWTSGGMQFYHKPSANFLRFQGSYRTTPTGDKTATGFHPTKNIPFGEWVEWITAYKYGLHDGRSRHWINGELIYDFKNICTDPQPEVGNKGEYFTPRFYIGTPINMPQHIYLTDLALSDAPFDITPPPPPIPLWQVLLGFFGAIGAVGAVFTVTRPKREKSYNVH